MLRPDSGKVTVGGKVVADLKRADLSELRRGMGMLFQYAALFDSMTVADNVSFAMRQHTKMSNQITIASAMKWMKFHLSSAILATLPIWTSYSFCWPADSNVPQ